MNKVDSKVKESEGESTWMCVTGCLALSVILLLAAFCFGISHERDRAAKKLQAELDESTRLWKAEQEENRKLNHIMEVVDFKVDCAVKGLDRKITAQLNGIDDQLNGIDDQVKAISEDLKPKSIYNGGALATNILWMGKSYPIVTNSLYIPLIKNAIFITYLL